MEYWEVYDEVTNKTLHIKADSLESAEGIADTLSWEDEKDGDYIDLTGTIENYVE